LNAPTFDAEGQYILYGANPVLQNPAAAQQAPWDYPSSSQDNFCAAMLTRLGQPFAANEITVAGKDSSSCTAAMGAFNPAFVTVSSGLADADLDGSLFDGLNSAAAGGTSPCVENPSRAASSSYQDQVAAGGLAELYGRMCLKGRYPFDASIWNIGGGP
jgi:hypothetical protein